MDEIPPLIVIYKAIQRIGLIIIKKKYNVKQNFMTSRNFESAMEIQ